MIVPPEKGGEIEDQFEPRALRPRHVRAPHHWKLHVGGHLPHDGSAGDGRAHAHDPSGSAGRCLRPRTARSARRRHPALCARRSSAPWTSSADRSPATPITRSSWAATGALNYGTLGQNTLDGDLMGWACIQRYNDFAECGVGDTWGVWLTQTSEQRGEDFQHSNPYRASRSPSCSGHTAA